MLSLKKHPLISGTLILTATGLVSRIIGFFYRIYLSRLFGEEGMGIYQLLGPVLALSFSLTAAGLQTAISKYVASETSTGDYSHSLRVLLKGLFLSLLLSGFTTGFIYINSDFLAISFLKEPRTASMLRIVSLSIPMGAVHSCINGYFYGIKKTAVPAITQLLEQSVRVGFVLFIGFTLEKKNAAPSINLAVFGLVLGECVSMLISIIAIYYRFYKLPLLKSQNTASIYRNILKLAIPLSANRITINFLQSIEAIYIPNRLLAYGYDTKTALSVYGVLTGMALPLILFPNALTGSVSVLLLPIVSEADAIGNKELIKKTIMKTIRYCSILGIACLLFFLLFGKMLGHLLFNSPLAGHFIMTLSFICPFLYLGSTLSSILHGLGKAGQVFLINVFSLSIRLAFVFLTIPKFGISGYLCGLLCSQCASVLLYFLFLFLRRPAD